MFALEAVPRLTPVILRHLRAYGELACLETGEAVRQWQRRAWGLLIAVAAALIAIGLGCLWVIAASWDGPHRLAAVGALCVGFAVAALVAAAYVSGNRGAPPFQRLAGEVRMDLRELLALDPQLTGELESTPERAGHDGH